MSSNSYLKYKKLLSFVVSERNSLVSYIHRKIVDLKPHGHVFSEMSYTLEDSRTYTIEDDARMFSVTDDRTFIIDVSKSDLEIE